MSLVTDNELEEGDEGRPELFPQVDKANLASFLVAENSVHHTNAVEV